MQAELSNANYRIHAETIEHTATLTLRGDGFACTHYRAERIARAMAPSTWPQEADWRVECTGADERGRVSTWTVRVAAERTN